MEIKLGATIKKLRIQKGITQEELAEYMGISYQAVSKWETNTTMPDITLLPKLAVFFGVRIDDLFSINTDDELERIDHILDNEQLTDKSFSYAKKTLDSILRNNENDVEAIKRYAKLLLARANHDSLDAGSILEKGMAVEPLDSDIFWLYRLARGGEKMIAQSGNDWFIRVCEPYAIKYPQNIKLCELLIEAMIDMRYFDKAEKFIELLDPKGEISGLKNVFLGDIELAKGNIEKAKQLWNMVDIYNIKGQFEAGERFNRACDYDKAIVC